MMRMVDMGESCIGQLGGEREEEWMSKGVLDHY